MPPVLKQESSSADELWRCRGTTRYGTACWEVFYCIAVVAKRQILEGSFGRKKIERALSRDAADELQEKDSMIHDDTEQHQLPPRNNDHKKRNGILSRPRLDFSARLLDNVSILQQIAGLRCFTILDSLFRIIGEGLRLNAYESALVVAWIHLKHASKMRSASIKSRESTTYHWFGYRWLRLPNHDVVHWTTVHL